MKYEQSWGWNRLSGFWAGFFISLGCCVYAAAGGGIWGALLFSIGLIMVIEHSTKLYTGMVGRITDKMSLLQTIHVLFCNIIGVCYARLFLLVAKPSLNQAVTEIGLNKLESTSLWGFFFSGLFCGILIYFATVKGLNIIPVIMLVAVFILCGFDHSIADFFYWVFSDIGMEHWIIPWLLVVLGNAAGATIARYLLDWKTQQIKEEQEKMMMNLDKDEENAG